MTCRACAAAGVDIVYEAPHDRAFTSALAPIAARIRLAVCRACGHCMTLDMPPPAFYDEAYEYLMSSDDEDDLFGVAPDGTPIYRQALELQNLDALVTLPAAGTLLDYGCGKGAFLRRFLVAHPAWTAHAYETSERYRGRLARAVPPSHVMIDALDESRRFDLVVMFQVVEHLADPVAVLAQLRGMLNPGGLVHVTVPNLFAYSVDLFIADHVSHFTPVTLDVVFARAGYVRVAGSTQVQAGQITATYRAGAGEPANEPDMRRRVERELARWTTFADEARTFAAAHAPVAIYGAGAAGTFVAMAIVRAHAAAFLDRNPFKVGREHLGLPIRAPESCGALGGVIAALAPDRAREILAGAGLAGRGFPILYPS